MRTFQASYISFALIGTLLSGATLATPNPQFNLSKIFKTATDGAKALKEVPEADEIVLGQEITSSLLNLGPILQNKEVQAYVNKVGRWVSSHSERPDLPWTFVVLDLPDTNAFAAPGGYVVITKGLLLRLSSEAELAGVLGHEISHVVQKHHLAAIKSADTKAFAKSLTDTALEITGKANRNTKFATDIIMAGLALYGNGIDHEDEYEADRMGVVLATRAGYDPFALPAALQSINGNKGHDLNLLFSTHPPVSNRLDRLDQVMGSKFDRYDAQPTVENRYQKIRDLLSK